MTASEHDTTGVAAAPPREVLSGMDRLLAMEEMKNARMTFCRALDDHDWRALRETMTDGFELYFADETGTPNPGLPEPAEMKGADTFVAFAQQLLGHGRSVHICAMPQFDFIDSDHAKALWYIIGYGDIGAQTGLGFERLVDDYVRIDGKWLIERSDARIQAHIAFSK